MKKSIVVASHVLAIVTHDWNQRLWASAPDYSIFEIHNWPWDGVHAALSQFSHPTSFQGRPFASLPMSLLGIVRSAFPRSASLSLLHNNLRIAVVEVSRVLKLLLLISVACSSKRVHFGLRRDHRSVAVRL